MGPVLLDPQGEFVTVQLSKQIADRIVAFYVTCYEPESGLGSAAHFLNPLCSDFESCLHSLFK